MSDEQLRTLLDGNFNECETVKIILGEAAPEDVERNNGKKPRKPKRDKINSRTYDIYVPQYLKWKEDSANRISLNSGIILGCYLYQYEQAFGEEDPEWAGSHNISLAVRYINQMRTELKIEFAQIVEFLETLLPLWASALRKNLDFPNTRPTYRTFFQNRRIWAQRFTYYRQWS